MEKYQEKREIYWKKEQCFEMELKRLENAPISSENKKLIKEFHTHLFSKQCSNPRVYKLSCELRKICEFLGGKSLDKMEKEDITNLLVWINRTETWSDETKKDYRCLIRQYCLFKYGKRSEIADEVVLKYTKKRQVTRDLISEEDIIKIIRTIRNPRDKALIFCLYETGARIGEFLNIRIKDLVKKDNMMKVRLFGKTGERWIMIHSCVPHLFSFLDKHSHRDDPQSFLWLGEHNKYLDKPLAYPGLVKIVRKCFQKAKLGKITGEYKSQWIGKQCNPHNFRHSRATELAKYLTEVQLCLYFGWRIGSKQVATYVHASGRDLDSAMAKMHGIKTEEETLPKLTPLLCKICNKTNDCIATFCSQCGTPLTVKAAMESQEKLKEATSEGIQMLMKIAQDEELMKRFQEFLEGKKGKQYEQ